VGIYSLAAAGIVVECLQISGYSLTSFSVFLSRGSKYVVPTPIEDAISMSRFISQVVLTGANRPYNVALLVPEWATIRTELKINDSVSDDELASDERVKELIDKEIAKGCAHLKKFEVSE